MSSTLKEPAASANLPAVREPVVFRRVGSTVRTFGPPLLVFAGFLGFWYFMSYVVLDPARQWLLPPPHAVIIDGLVAPEPRGEILMGLVLTAMVAFMGLAISFVLGTLGAILMSQAKWIERSLYPYAVLMQTIPVLAIVPLLGFWFGLGIMSRVVVCVIISLFPLVINTLTGLLGADRGLHDLMTLHNASRWTRLVRLQIPSAMPDIFTGLRTSAGLSVIGAIVGDFFFGRGPTGLGLLLNRYASRLESAKLLAAVFVACSFGVLVFTLFGVLGRRAVGDWSEAWRDPGDT
jgi:NitT/TauT family transport system permease protein